MSTSRNLKKGKSNVKIPQLPVGEDYLRSLQTQGFIVIDGSLYEGGGKYINPFLKVTHVLQDRF